MQLRNQGAELLQPGDELSSPFRPDDSWPGILLPSQQFFRSRPTHEIDGELNLMAAVLIDAIVCFQRGRNGSRETYRQYLEAKSWIESRSAKGLFSFENVCAALGLDPGAVRRRLKVLTRQGDEALSLGERRRHQSN